MTIAMLPGERRSEVPETSKQCSVLLVNPGDALSPHRAILEECGFLVTEAHDWPEDWRAVLDHQVVLIRIRNMNGAPMLAARLRAKPHFGRRVLFALVTEATTNQDRLSARTSGFDEVLADSASGRQLVARILRHLRSRPEYHCFLPPDRDRPAA
jgi:DNA-binding response OmpR family regulator